MVKYYTENSASLHSVEGRVGGGGGGLEEEWKRQVSVKKRWNRKWRKMMKEALNVGSNRGF